VKEITDCMKAVNYTLPHEQKLILSGKKDEIVARFASFIAACVVNKRRTSISNIVKIVNETAPRK
jgi:hypothetical protein